jgi:hypothetical protein
VDLLLRAGDTDKANSHRRGGDTIRASAVKPGR